MPRQIVVPFDDSPHSRKALEYAIETFPHGEITALHVVDPTNRYMYGDSVANEAIFERKQKRGEELLERAHELARDRGVDIETELETGAPARVVNTYAHSHDVDHVVMGSHGRSGVGRILLGSVAERVVRRSSVPVTILR
ncbi:universal stress protein [Natronolimnohabitans innermongolicus]|uniref:UspA domain-containing protein n=1 Tax=Natronolimnohabitans innermongolicus JCM 12255 TaxID=1227499 RepID=L9XI72_9EURY|nr:universal stress protein [Natronolimnohabitans innermongolicus]ELY61096.1 UspA domain-containing protein [Natronolimnohabitans innermongolicus JCM 12255]